MGTVVSLPSSLPSIIKNESNVSISDLKSLLNAQLEETVDISFAESINKAISYRNNIIKQLKHFINSEFCSNPDTRKHGWIRTAFQLCNQAVKSPMTLAMFDRCGLGKTTLVEKVIQNKIELPIPSNDLLTNVTRFTYADNFILRKIHIVKETLDREQKFKEVVISERRLKSLSPDDINNCLAALDRRSSNIIDKEVLFIEIGVPSDILKNGLMILDCALLDDSFGLSIDEKLIMNALRPDILCYMYDHETGFTEEDGLRLDEINDVFCRIADYHCQYILVECFQNYKQHFCDGSPSSHKTTDSSFHCNDIEEEGVYDVVDSSGPDTGQLEGNKVNTDDCANTQEIKVETNSNVETKRSIFSKFKTKSREKIDTAGIRSNTLTTETGGEAASTKDRKEETDEPDGRKKKQTVRKIMFKIDFDPNTSSKNIFNNCRFRKSNGLNQVEKWYRFDKERLLPVVPLLIRSDTESEVERTQDLNDGLVMTGRQMLLKIIHHSISLIETMAAEILTPEMLNPHSRFEDPEIEHRVNLWFVLKSLCVETDLTQLIDENCSSGKLDSLIVSFNKGYRVFALTYRDKPIQVTLISNKFNEKLRICTERFQQNDDVASIVYEPDDQSAIYLIDKGPTHTRLMDFLEEFNLYEIQTLIKRVAESHCSLKEHRPNFRPDNLYIDMDGSLYVNRNIPNDHRLPFILKDSVKVKPFHIHPRINQICPYFDQTNEKSLVEFIYCFGWFIWIMVDGTGSRYMNSCDHDIEEWLDQLEKFGRFRTCPSYLKDAMQKCWNISNSLSQFDLEIALNKEWEQILAIITQCTWN